MLDKNSVSDVANRGFYPNKCVKKNERPIRATYRMFSKSPTNMQRKPLRWWYWYTRVKNSSKSSMWVHRTAKEATQFKWCANQGLHLCTHERASNWPALCSPRIRSEKLPTRDQRSTSPRLTQPLIKTPGANQHGWFVPPTPPVNHRHTWGDFTKPAATA